MVSPSRRLATVALASVVLFLGLGIAPAMAGTASSFVNKVNSARASQGRDPVQVYWDLTDDARAHARNMMKRGEVFANPKIGSVTTGWNALGEVVGVGPSVGLLFDAFMKSSSSRSTILGSSYNYIGVGAVTDENGIIWVAMILMNGPDGLVDPPPAATTTTTSTIAPPSTPPTTKSPAATTTTHQPSATTAAPPAAIAETEQPSATAEPFASSTTQALLPTPDSEPPSPTTSTATLALRGASSTTTTTAQASDGGKDPLDSTGTAGSGEDRGILTGGLVAFGLIAFAGGGLILFSRTGRDGRTSGAAPVEPTTTTALETCTSCGLVFDQQKRSRCPKCGAPA